jgi:hypothetical protein
MVRFSFWKSKEERDHEAQLAKLRRAKELKSAQLEASEIDDEVIEARRRVRIIEELTRGIRDEAEYERMIRTLGRDLGITELSKEMSAEKQMEVLKGLNDEDFDKMKKMFEAQKDGMLLSHEKPKKRFRSAKKVESE